VRIAENVTKCYLCYEIKRIIEKIIDNREEKETIDNKE